jgi:hypothetical protein
MKYKLDNEKKEKPEPEVRLTLKRDSEGAVCLMADDWYILTFESDGQIKRCRCVPSNLGFKVDSLGRVLLINEQ